MFKRSLRFAALALALLWTSTALAAKPSAGTSLDSGNALYTNLSHAWAFLEGSGTTSADSKGTNTLTLSSSGLWATDADGPLIGITTGTANPVALGTTLTLDGSQSWSVAFRAKQTTNGTLGMVMGDTTTNSFVWLEGGTALDYRDNGTDRSFSGITTFTSLDDYVLTFDHAALKTHLYHNGTEINSGGLSSLGKLTVDRFGNGYSGTTFALVGQISYVYQWDNRVLSGTEATTLHSNPYAIFLTSTASITEQNLPSNHTGNITVHAVGTGTSWTSSTTWTASNVAGWSVASKTFVDATHYTLNLSGPTAATPPSGATGTLNLTEGVTGTSVATTTIGTPMLAVSPTSSGPNTTPTVTLTGTNTLWSTETAAGLFTETGGTGASIGTPTVTTNTSATATLTTGSALTTLTLKDTSTGATQTFSVSNTPITYDLTAGSVAGVYVQVEGGATLGTFGGSAAWGQPSASWTDGSLHFQATIGQLDVLSWNNGSVVRLTIDGVDGPSATVAAGANAYVWTTVSTTLDATKQHDYVLSFGNTMFVQKVRTTNGAGINSAYLPARKVLATYGDSILLGENGTGNDSTLGISHHVGRLLGYQVLNRGVGGSAVIGSGDTRTVDITGLTPAADVVLILYGTNDYVNGATQNAFGASYTAMLQKLQTGCPSALIMNQRLLKTGIGDTTRDPYSATISAKVAAMGTPKIVYGTSAWGAYDGSIGIHPDPAHDLVIARAVANEIQSALAGPQRPRYRIGSK